MKPLARFITAYRSAPGNDRPPRRSRRRDFSVNFARAQGLDLAIRGGSHNVAGFGTCDHGLVVDLSSMKGIRVDPVNRTVRAEGGCTWGDLDHATHAFGLATTGGVISTTGIAGLTLGGGFGHLSRKYGLSCDNLLSVDIVTADGQFRTASASENPDLFWAVRGGGGNFGVVTSLEFKLHPVSTVIAGPDFLFDRAGPGSATPLQRIHEDGRRRTSLPSSRS